MPHQGRHLRLRELRLLANFARGHGYMNDGRTFALCMGQCLVEGLDQVFSERAHMQG